MTAQEKAKELVDKFDGVGLQQRNEAIACALIAVDEIIELSSKSRIILSEMQGNVLNQYTETFYWEQVKQEIELL